MAGNTHTKRDSTSKYPARSPFYDGFIDVPHNRKWADGNKIWIVNGANYDEYVFKQTNRQGAGQWLPTGATTGAAASW